MTFWCKHVTLAKDEDKLGGFQVKILDKLFLSVYAIILVVISLFVLKTQLDRPVMYVSDVTGHCLRGKGPQGELACDYFEGMRHSQYNSEKVFDQRTTNYD